MKAKTLKIRFSYVFWKTFDRKGHDTYSLLHRTADGIDTLCKIKIHHLLEDHHGIRMKKTEPAHHSLSICPVCRSQVLNAEMK